MTVDTRVYAVLDPARCRDRPLGEMAEAAARGGATLLQYRDKTGSTRRLIEAAGEIGRALAPYSVPLLINDRVDVALAAGCAGVHVGAEDMPAADARRLLGAGAIVGCTVHSAEEADALPDAVLDYVSVGGVFATASKHNPQPPIGLDGVRSLIARLPDVPVCAIAGIDHRNAAEVIAAGAAGVAVISDIFMADDVEVATRRLRGVVDSALAGRSAS
ncbi:MAG: thiamine phosphate synthase [Hyphomicrobiales bacterium]